MAKFAAYDTAVVGLTPVTGWYDTDMFDYANLPDGMLPVADDAWAARFDTPFVLAGVLVAPPDLGPSPPVVPATVTNFQCRAVLLGMPGAEAGKTLFDDVDAALHTLGGVKLAAWEYSTTFDRTSPLLAALAAQFNLTPAILDQLFITGAGITA